MPTFTTRQIAERVGGQLRGPGDLPIHGVDQLDEAAPGQMTFIRNNHHAQAWSSSKASAVLVSGVVDLDPGPGRAVIEVKNADLAMAVVLAMFEPPPPRPDTGVHPSATVHPSAQIAPDAAIGPGCVIGKRVRVGNWCVLHAHATVLDDSVLGSGCELFPGVVIYSRCELGANVRVHANVVIGSDGFGYRPAPDGRSLIKVPQIGSVKIGNDVEIGAGTCIDRGKFAATVIGDGTKIDNQCQIAHNCRIGRCCIIAGQVGLAGGVTLGDGAVLGGKVGVVEHITIGAGARIGAHTAVVSGDVPPGETWLGYPARKSVTTLREWAALHKLPGLMKLLRKRNDHPDGE